MIGTHKEFVPLSQWRIEHDLEHVPSSNHSEPVSQSHHSRSPSTSHNLLSTSDGSATMVSSRAPAVQVNEDITMGFESTLACGFLIFVISIDALTIALSPSSYRSLSALFITAYYMLHRCYRCNKCSADLSSMRSR